jgi:hypothetical protein
MSKESDLENLLAGHPYLISEEFSGLKPQRQLTRGKNRLDLMFELPDGLCIVELKKTPLVPDDVRQLQRYCRVWSRLPRRALNTFHYLIGKRPADESGFQTALMKSRFEIRILFIDEHIPTMLTWDRTARRYVSYDPSLPSSDFLNLVF